MAPNEDNSLSGFRVKNTFENKLNNKKKGVTEFADLTRYYAPNYNEKFTDSLNNNKDSFKIYTGIYSKVHDDAHKIGNIIDPFKGGGMAKPHNPQKHRTYLQNLRHKRSLSNIFKVSPPKMANNA